MDQHVSNDSIPVASPYVDNSDLDISDVEDAAEHIFDVSSARTTRSQSPSPGLSGAEEEAESPSAFTQAAKSYKCDLERSDGGSCQRSFDRRNALNRHQLGSAHMPAMPCPFCPSPSKLRHRQRLTIHVKKSHPEKMWTEFRCPFCTNTPSSHRSLVSHVTNNHANMPLEARTRATRGF